MNRVRSRGEDVRRFIIENVGKHPGDIASVTARKFGITRQAVSKHLSRLTAEGALTETGETRNKKYALAPVSEWSRVYEIRPGLAEDLVWTQDIKGVLGALPDNVLLIWQHGFTEMFNNAIDHSGGTSILVKISKTPAHTEMLVMDDGIGIFRKIQTELGLLDERHAILELSKGKLTTDPSRHSGEGIFFTSRMFDSFRILSGGAFFSHSHGEARDWLLETDQPTAGTAVFMQLANHTSRTTKKVFDAYVSGEDYDFSKTVVPVRLAQYGNDKLISRSQAKRVLARIELFKTVVLDFADVDTIGQAFADEIFRVFANQHPEISLLPINTSEEVAKMIRRARSGAMNAPPSTPKGS